MLILYTRCRVILRLPEFAMFHSLKGGMFCIFKTLPSQHNITFIEEHQKIVVGYSRKHFLGELHDEVVVFH